MLSAVTCVADHVLAPQLQEATEDVGRISLQITPGAREPEEPRTGRSVQLPLHMFS